MQAMTLNEAGQDLLSVMNRVNDDHEPLLLNYKHQKSMVIMTLEHFNAWQETACFTRISANTKDLPEAVNDNRTPTVRRKPSPKIVGKGRILGDIMTPVVAAEEWSVLS